MVLANEFNVDLIEALNATMFFSGEQETQIRL